MYRIKFVFKGIQCELVDGFDDRLSAASVAREYTFHPGVSGVRIEVV